MTVPQLRKALHAHRMERGYGYDRLALAVGPDHVTARTLRRFIAGEGIPSEMTVYAINAYLTRQAPEAVAS